MSAVTYLQKRGGQLPLDDTCFFTVDEYKRLFEKASIVADLGQGLQFDSRNKASEAVEYLGIVLGLYEPYMADENLVRFRKAWESPKEDFLEEYGSVDQSRRKGLVFGGHKPKKRKR